MTAKVAILVALGIALCAALWLWLGPEWAAAPLAIAAARKVRRVRPPAPVEADDEATLAAIDTRAAEAARAAADEAADGWATRPVRSRPRLDLVLLLCILPAAARAEPPITDGCVELGEYGPHAAAAGFGVWREQGREMHCPCLPAAAYGDVTRVPAGCVVDVPSLAYSLEAHAGVVADLARAKVLVDGLRVTLAAAHRERDRQAHAAAIAAEDAQASLTREVELVARLAAQEQATHAARAQAGEWWTWRSVVLSSVAIVVTAGSVYAACSTWGCGRE